MATAATVRGPRLPSDARQSTPVSTLKERHGAVPDRIDGRGATIDTTRPTYGGPQTMTEGRSTSTKSGTTTAERNGSRRTPPIPGAQEAADLIKNTAERAAERWPDAVATAQVAARDTQQALERMPNQGLVIGTSFSLGLGRGLVHERRQPVVGIDRHGPGGGNGRHARGTRRRCGRDLALGPADHNRQESRLCGRDRGAGFVVPDWGAVLRPWPARAPLPRLLRRQPRGRLRLS